MLFSQICTCECDSNEKQFTNHENEICKLSKKVHFYDYEVIYIYQDNFMLIIQILPWKTSRKLVSLSVFIF